MTDIHTHGQGAHDNAYAGLLVDDTHWAFGTSFEDPLEGVDTTVPEGVDAGALAAYCLGLGDDALILSQRLAEWCSRAPDLEEDIALANIALDLLGQARLLLARAAAADPTLVPAIAEGSPVPDEDRLAFFRDAGAFANMPLVELPNGDFAETICRILVFASYRLALFERLAGDPGHPDAVVRAVAAKGVKELAYHRDFAARWFVTLARGTEESRRRLEAGLETVWAHRHQFDADPAAEAVLDQVLAAAGVDAPDVGPAAIVGGHTEHLSRVLAQMQSVARAHPMGRW